MARWFLLGRYGMHWYSLPAPCPLQQPLRGVGSPSDNGMGSNLHAASRIGIDTVNGEITWHDQTTPREGWDHNGVNEVVSDTDRARNDFFAGADRNGFFYLLIREDATSVCAGPLVKDISRASGIWENGHPIFGEENRPDDPTATADSKKEDVVFASPSFLDRRDLDTDGPSVSGTATFTYRPTHGAWTTGMS